MEREGFRGWFGHYYAKPKGSRLGCFAWARSVGIDVRYLAVVGSEQVAGFERFKNQSAVAARLRD